MWVPPHAGRVVEGGVLEAPRLQTLNLLGSQRLHVVLRSPRDGVRGAGLHARRLQPRLHPIDAHVALVHFAGGRIESGDVERATRNAQLAADALFLIEVDDPVLVLDDRPRRRACVQTAGLLAVKTGVLLDQPLEIIPHLDLVEAHEEPGVGRQVPVALHAAEVLRGLHTELVPFLARHLAPLAADTTRDVHELRVLGTPPDSRCRIGRCGDALDGKDRSGKSGSSHLLQIHEEGLELGTVGVRITDKGREVVGHGSRGDPLESPVDRDADGPARPRRLP